MLKAPKAGKAGLMKVGQVMALGASIATYFGKHVASRLFMNRD